MQKRIHRAFTRARERTCVSYAKIATMGGMCDVDLIITKATPLDDFPLQERYVHELLNIFSISPSSYSAFALAFARRFRKTHSWRVALKCLLLLHRLLRSFPDHGPFRTELLWARTNGMLSLHPCNFRDCTSSASHDYTAFVRAYAKLLDEALDCVSIQFEFEHPQLHAHYTSLTSNSTKQNHEFEEEDEISDEDDEDLTLTPRTPKLLGRTIAVLPQLQSLIDRAIDCWPIGVASRSFLVQAAMKHVIRDSIRHYAAFREEIEKVLENLIRLPHRSCAAAFAVYKRAAAQAEQLSRFHEWCKSMGYCGSYEYPLIDRIPEIQIRALETFLAGMWQLTDQSSDTNASEELSPSNCGGGGGERRASAEMEVEPLLIKWEEDEESKSSGGGWEELLEASINSNAVASRSGWEMVEVYNPYGFQTPNPFYQQQPNRMDWVNYGGSCPNTPLQQQQLPWIGMNHAACA